MSSLDSRISRMYGVDNDLCIPYYSVSYWAIVAMFTVDIAMLIRQGQAQFPKNLFLGALSLGALVFLTMLRGRIQQLSISHPEISADLRKLSSWSVRITGALMMACILAGSRV